MTIRKKIKNILRPLFHLLSKNIQQNLHFYYYNFTRDASFIRKKSFWVNKFDNIEILSRTPLYRYNTVLEMFGKYYNFKNGDVIIDGGAHRGYTSIYFSKLVGDSGKVFSFEVDKKSIKVFKDTIKLNNSHNINLVENLLWSKSTELDFAESGEELSSVHYNTKNVKKVKKKAISIDDFAEKNNLERIDFIKMNIEGAEIETLYGSRNIINKFSPSFAISADHTVNGKLTYIDAENSIG